MAVDALSTSRWPQGDLKATSRWPSIGWCIWYDCLSHFYHPKMVQSYVSRIALEDLWFVLLFHAPSSDLWQPVGIHSNFMGKAIVSGLPWFLEPSINVSNPSWATFLFKHEGFIHSLNLSCCCDRTEAVFNTPEWGHSMDTNGSKAFKSYEIPYESEVTINQSQLFCCE